MANTENILVGHHYLVITAVSDKDYPYEIEILQISVSSYKMKHQSGQSSWITKEAFNQKYTIVEHLPRDLNDWAE